jgi:hypothetical protein
MERTMAELRKRGLRYHKVETWNPHARRRVDMFNIIDVVALDALPDGAGILGIQVTDQKNYAAHYTALRDDEKKREPLAAWLRSGGTFEIWAWAKYKVKRGGKAHRWRLNRYEAVLQGIGIVVRPVRDPDEPDLLF